MSVRFKIVKKKLKINPAKRLILIFLLGNLYISIINAINLYGVTNSHDPATIIKDGDTYWHFTTGDGIWSSKSTNLTTWSAANMPVFPIGTFPDWIKTYVSDFSGQFWAPDIIHMNGYYYLYYSCSSWGTTKSAIGVARTLSLNEPDWEDMGMVVYSDGSSTAINAIDPGLFKDTNGKIYMTYGSFFGGIGIVEIDSVSGKTTTSVSRIYGGGHQSIEAPYLFKEGDYYYLVVNRGSCCQGVNSTYYITAGRSTNVYGPYSDWSTILANKEGKYIGPGHFGLYREGCMNYVSTHYYDANQFGMAKLDILKMTFENEWPVLTREYELNDCITGINTFSTYKVNGLIISSNPAKGNQIQFQVTDKNLENKKADFNIYSMDGKLLYRKTNTLSEEITLNTSLNTGIYLILIKCNQQSFYSRIFIQ